MAWVTASLSKSTGHVTAENTCNHSYYVHKTLTFAFLCYVLHCRGGASLWSANV